MKAVCFFNNKGGVGKTTLACNVASYIAAYHSRRVILVDADPQCNATQLVLSERKLTELYRRGRTALKQTRKQSAVTLFDVLQPVAAGEPSIHGNVTPLSRAGNRFQLDLIPGHPEVALLEDKLSQGWLGFGGGDLGGARITNWCTQLNTSLDAAYDLAIYDVGPSLGALNRTVLIGVDYFLTPMSCDIFSIMGVSNISGWLSRWLAAYSDAISKCKQTWDISEYPIRSDLGEIARFVGYTVQQYITKSKGGERRPTKAFERYLKDIPPTVATELGQFISPHVEPSDLRLPDVPHMYSLVPLAQNANAPIHSIESADGLLGAQYAQKDEYQRFINRLSTAILNNLNLEES